MSCVKSYTNNEDSILHEQLLSIVEDEQYAKELYTYFDTEHNDHFMEMFGDYVANWHNGLEDSAMAERTDENGEPKLFFNKKINKYYFKDKVDEPVYYPYEQTGLHEVFDSEEIREFTNILALKFYERNMKYDYNSLTFQSNNTQLRTFIEEFIDEKIEDLEAQPNVDMVMNAMSLRNARQEKHIDEWLKHVKGFYQSLQIKVADEVVETTEEYDDATDTILQTIVRREAWSKSSRDDISSNIKLSLSLASTDEVNNFNENTFVPFDEIASSLNRVLAGKFAGLLPTSGLEDIFELYMEGVEELAKVKPHFRGLVPKDVNDEYKNQFVSAFYLVKNNFLGSEASRDEEGNLTYTVRNLTEVSSKKNNILEQWYFNLVQTLENNTVGNLRREADKNSTEFRKNFKSIKSEEGLFPYMQKLKDSLNSFGIEFSEEGMKFFLNNLTFEQTSLDNRKQRILETYTKLDRVAAKKVETDDNVFLDQSLFKQIADAESFFLPEGKDVSFFSAGKNKWAYSTPSYLDVKVGAWIKNPNILYKHYMKTGPFNQGSHYMEYLTAMDISRDEADPARIEKSRERIEAIELTIFNSIQQEGDSKNSADSKNMSYTDSIVDYLNKILAHKKGAKVYHKTALAADKNTERQIHYGNDSAYFNLDANVSLINGKAAVNDKIVEIFYKYYKSEYKRIAKVYAEINGKDADLSKLMPNYHLGNKNGLQSQLFPTLSPTYKGKSIVIPDLGFDLFTRKGEPIHADLDTVKARVKEHISTSISEGVIETYALLQENGVFTYDIHGNRLNVGVDTHIYSSYASRENSPVALQIAADMYVNSIISQVEYSKMFSGDVAYYKHFHDYRKRVPATYTDGKYQRLNMDSYHFNIAVIEAVKVSPVLLDQMKKTLPEEIWKAYEGKTDMNDAQAWITPTRWKSIMDGLGKTSVHLESAYQKLLKPNPEFSKEELKLLAQPLKGVYFDITNGIPVYLKYSQAVLVPNLIKGSPLQKIYDNMVKNNIDEVVDNGAIKVGYPIPTKTHDAKGNILDDFELQPLQLNNAHWKLQQDLPTKGVKMTDIGSQLRDNVFLGLAYNQEKTFDVGNEGGTKSGTDLIKYINSITQALSDVGVRKLTQTLGLNEEFKIENERVLYSSIIKQLKLRNDIPNNYIDALEAGLSPYAIPGLLSTFQNVFSKLINKAVIKLQTPGGGFIQMSDYGLSKTEAEEQGVMFTPWFKSTKLHTPKIVTDKNGKETVTPGGVFISGSYIAKFLPNYKDYTSPELFGTLNPQTGKYEGGMIDPKIFQNVIGYRIPNQGLPSSDALVIMGILPEEVADTVVAYTGITTKTGSDYDIDKMYLMLASIIPIYSKAYKRSVQEYINEVGITYEVIQEELEDVGYNLEGMSKREAYTHFIDDILLSGNEEDNYYYRDFHASFFASSMEKKEGEDDIVRLMYASPTLDKDGNERPIHEQSEETLRNKLIESYKAVFASPHTFTDVMKPIDVPYMESDIINLNEEKENKDLLNFNAINDLKTKHEFKTAKAGLGQGINSLADKGRGSLAEQYLAFQIDGLTEGQTELDDEFSETLSKADIAAYVKSYNARKAEDVDEITVKDIAKLEKVTISDSFMALANAYVDVANNPFIVEGNWNTQTNPVGFMLLRAGMHPFKVNAFLGQSIIKDYILYKGNKESKIIDDAKNVDINFKLKNASELILPDETVTIGNTTVKLGRLFRTVVKAEDVAFENKVRDRIKSNVRKRFGITIQDLQANPELVKQLEQVTWELYDVYQEGFGTELRGFEHFSLKDLRNEIDDPNIASQNSLLDIFLDWQQKAKDLTEGVNASKITVNGKGKNITSLLVAKNTLVKLLKEQTKLKNFKSKLTFQGQDTFLNTAMKNSIIFPENIMKANPKYFFTASNSVFTTFNAISTFIQEENLIDTKLGDKLEKSYYSYVMSGVPSLSMNREQKETLMKEFPAEFDEFKKNNPDNMLLNELYNKRSAVAKEFFTSAPNIKNTVSYKNRLTDAFRNLMEEQPEFTDKLIKYSFLISGFNNSMNQFHEYIPFEWFNKNRVNSYLKTLDVHKKFVDRIFINQFFRHSSEDTSVVRNIFSNKMQGLTDTDYFHSGYILKDADEHAPYLTKYKTDEQGFWYFKLEGRNTAGQAIYTRTSVLGYSDRNGNKAFEYDLNSNVASKPMRSAFKGNKLFSNKINSDLVREIRGRFDISSEISDEAVSTDANIVQLKPIEEVEADFFDKAVAKGQTGPRVFKEPSVEVKQDDNTPTDIVGLNERIAGYGQKSITLSDDYYEGKVKGRLNSFRSSIAQVADNLQILKDLDLSEFKFISKEDLQRLEDLRPLVRRFGDLNLLVSVGDKRTVALEKEFAGLTSKILTEFVDIMNPYIKSQIGKSITLVGKNVPENLDKSEKSGEFYEGNITPDANTIFVFGSNPEGRHGKGAALIAKNKFGAKYGQGEGLQGNAYALPTKDLRIKENKGLRSIHPAIITTSINKLYSVAEANPDKQFKIAFRNKADEFTLNGYSGREMIEMFNDVAEVRAKRRDQGIPSNIIFSKEWHDTGLLKRNTPENLDKSEKSGTLADELKDDNESGEFDFNKC